MRGPVINALNAYCALVPTHVLSYLHSGECACVRRVEWCRPAARRACLLLLKARRRPRRRLPFPAAAAAALSPPSPPAPPSPRPRPPASSRVGPTVTAVEPRAVGARVDARSGTTCDARRAPRVSGGGAGKWLTSFGCRSAGQRAAPRGDARASDAGRTKAATHQDRRRRRAAPHPRDVSQE